MTIRPQFDRRSAGILMHITSLPGPYGNGDLGPEAHRFLDFLASAGQRWWQTLPVVAPSVPGFGPYSAQSAFAGSPNLISLELLADEGWISKPKPFGRTSSRANFEHAEPLRQAALRKSFEGFNKRFREHGDFTEFCTREREWLDDWALFAALKTRFQQQPWSLWDEPIRKRLPIALKVARRELADEIDFHRFLQYQFDRQWAAFRQAAARRNIGLLGDVPMFVAGDSCDVWANQKLFSLDQSGNPTSVSGCPPDMFSADGQFWGHPQYNWSAHRRSKFAWWVRRFEMELRRFDGVRIDHFLGFYRTWAIPAAAKSAKEGKWMMSPGAALFDAVHQAVGPAPIIAEDLGLLTPGAAKLRDRGGFPGMRVMQFGFDDPYYLPHRYIERCVAYTGTHDNNTTRGWFSALKPVQRKKVLAYLGCTAPQISNSMIRSLMASVAHTAVVPIQDVLDLGAADRMNLPGTSDNNWRWRLLPGQITSKTASRLRELTSLFERLPDASHPGTF